MNRNSFFLLFVFLFAPASHALDVAALIQHLSSDSFEGRRSGEIGAAMTADLIDSLLQETDLEPFGDAGSFRHSFTFLKSFGEQSFSLSQTVDNKLWKPISSGATLLAASSSGSCDGPLVFAGFGLDIPDLWQDLNNLDLEGACALVLRGNPTSVKAVHHQENLDLAVRVQNLRRRGAAAVLFVDNPFDPPLNPPSTVSSDPAFSHAGLPLLGITTSLADSLLPGSTTIRRLASQMNRRRKPLSNAYPEVHVRLDVVNERHEAEGWNLLARLPGNTADESMAPDESKAPGASEAPEESEAPGTLIIGAHYDHLGRGSSGTGLIHPGADDNASGTAQLLDLAQTFSNREILPASRPVVFAWFGAEELGLFGSRSWLEKAPLKPDQIAFMLNLDMLGRLRDKQMYLLGGKDNPRLDSLITHHASALGLEVKASPEMPGGGDHATFLEAGIPATLFFTGPHRDYHSPEDTFEALNLQGLAPISQLLEESVLAMMNVAFDFDPRPEIAQRRTHDVSEKLKVAFGLIPGYEPVEGGGMLVKAVHDSSPAMKGGLRGGDAILSVDRWPVNNIFDYTFALRHLQAGDTVRLLIRRDGQHITLSATLGERIQ